jgi:hypothetical protein
MAISNYNFFGTEQYDYAYDCITSKLQETKYQPECRQGSVVFESTPVKAAPIRNIQPVDEPTRKFSLKPL